MTVPLEHSWPSNLLCWVSWRCGNSRSQRRFQSHSWVKIQSFECEDMDENRNLPLVYCRMMVDTGQMNERREWRDDKCRVLDASGQINSLNAPSEHLSSSFQLKCCGFTNYKDFVGSKFEKENQGNLPPSCCWTNSPPCRPGEAQRSNVQVRKQRILWLKQWSRVPQEVSLIGWAKETTQWFFGFV